MGGGLPHAYETGQPSPRPSQRNAKQGGHPEHGPRRTTQLYPDSNRSGHDVEGALLTSGVPGEPPPAGVPVSAIAMKASRIATFLLLLFLGGLAIADAEKYEPTSLIALVADAERFDGVRISTIGFAVIEDETSALFFGPGDAENGVITNGVWLDLSATQLGGELEATLNQRYVYVEGVFEKAKPGAFGVRRNGALRKVRRISPWPFPIEERIEE
jgi:hypothetical protein